MALEAARESESFPVEIPFDQQPPPPPGCGDTSRLSRLSMASRTSCSSEFEQLQEAAATAFPAGSFGATLAVKLQQQKADAVRAKAAQAPDYKAKKHLVYDTERALRQALADQERAMQFEAPTWESQFPAEEESVARRRRYSSHTAYI